MGIFEGYAPEYRALGLSVIPVSGKRPLVAGWQHYCEAPASDEVFQAWRRDFSGANIGLCLGKASGLMGFDLDTDDLAITALVERLLPPTLLRKRGKKGCTYFYRYSSQRSRVLKVAGVQVADILVMGRQSVLPPSIHPDTNEPYIWCSGSGGTVLAAVVPWDKEALKAVPECPDALLDALEQELAGMGGKTRQKQAESPPLGRNDALKQYVIRNRHNPFEVLVRRAIKFDKKMHG
jgi:hypothetical protein